MTSTNVGQARSLRRPRRPPRRSLLNRAPIPPHAEKLRDAAAWLDRYSNEESNIRQIGYALDAERRHFGRTPPFYLMSEHAMHTYDAPVGWWTGPDGTRIAAMPTYQDEGAEFDRTTSDNWILTRETLSAQPTAEQGSYRKSDLVDAISRPAAEWR